MRVISWLVLPFLVLVCLAARAETAANWSADDPPCNRYSELLKQGHLNLGVRIVTANPLLAEQFRRAMDSWARILDLDWHDDPTESCSIQVVDGERRLFDPPAMVARSQLPDRLGFEGRIAFNPARTNSEAELYRISMHEIGHMFGLQHSSNATSVMYFLDLDGLDWLDTVDLAALAAHHKLRIAAIDKPVKLIGKPVKLIGPR